MRIMTGIFALVRALPSASLHLDTLSRGSGGRETREVQTVFDVFSIIANYIFRPHPQLPGQVFSTPYELAVTARHAKVLALHHICKRFWKEKFVFFIALNHLRACVCCTNAFPLKVALKMQELLRFSKKTTHFMSLSILCLPLLRPQRVRQNKSTNKLSRSGNRLSSHPTESLLPASSRCLQCLVTRKFYWPHLD